MKDAAQNIRRQYDLYQRYRLLHRILVAAFPSGQVRILDVGAGADDLSSAFLPERFIITLADTASFGRSDITILRPGDPLPFADRAFEVVLAMDVLEHVPTAERAGLVTELARVADSAVVLSHPTATAAVVAADNLLAAAYRSWFLAESHFLAEHSSHGLPPDVVATEALRLAGMFLVTFPNCPLVDWLPFTVLDVVLLAQFGVGDAKDLFNQRANELTGDLRTQGEHYRTFVLATRESFRLEAAKAAVSAAVTDRTAATDLSVAALLADTAVQLARNPTVTGMQKALEDKDEHIRKLEALLRDQGAV